MFGNKLSDDTIKKEIEAGNVALIPIIIKDFHNNHNNYLNWRFNF